MRQTPTVKVLVRIMVCLLLFGPAALSTHAAFSALYAFGDGVSSTTDNIDGGSSYYPYTYSNGRIWIQVLAQRQGVTYDSSKNVSYFDHTSADVVTDLGGFSATDANTSLFVVWVNDADFADYMLYTYPTYGLDPTKWNSTVSSSLANHQTIIQSLYAKGARTLILPNAVDLTEIPQYNGMSASQKKFIRQGIVAFNGSFAALLNQARASLPGVKIYGPDMFALLDNLAAHPADHGFINANRYAGQDGYTALNGPGADYLFWDPWDPTAKAHEIMADTVQQMVSPVRISDLRWLNGSNRLDLANAPIGLIGFVEGRTNIVSGSWASATNFISTSAAQSVFVRASGPRQTYRLRFPFAWSWP